MPNVSYYNTQSSLKLRYHPLTFRRPNFPPSFQNSVTFARLRGYYP